MERYGFLTLERGGCLHGTLWVSDWKEVGVFMERYGFLTGKRCVSSWNVMGL